MAGCVHFFTVMHDTGVYTGQRRRGFAGGSNPACEAPRCLLADGQDGEGDVLHRVVAEHAADSDVYTFLPVAADGDIRIRLELEAETLQVLPGTPFAVPRLGREEFGGQSGPEKASVRHRPVEAQRSPTVTWALPSGPPMGG